MSAPHDAAARTASSPQCGFGHAVVAGASMAGLLAARVLSGHFERITVIERDRLPRRAEPRKGVPQGRHVHVLLPRGLVILESLFPDLTGDLLSAGATKINAGRDLAWYYDGGWRTRHDSALELVAASRPLIELNVAARVRAIPNVRFREGARLEAPVVEAGAVTGAQVCESNRSEILTADLLVDATGRGSFMPRWLEQLGHSPPAPETIPAPVTYATCLFRPRDAHILQAALMARRSVAATILAGDFNAVPWERVTRRGMRVGSLLDPRVGRGLFPTYDTESYLMSWPLDQILFQPQFTVLGFDALADFGSDHRAVVATLCHDPAAVQAAPDLLPDDLAEAERSIDAARRNAATE